MGRRIRMEYTDTIYHVIHRGNNKEFIFGLDEDKRELLDYIQETQEKYPFTMLGYVIMNNHYHLIIKTHQDPLSTIMQRINNRYSKRYNKKFDRTGSIFCERYKAILVADDRYLLALLRYIHLNPVRGGICRNFDDYGFSSHLDYVTGCKGIADTDFILKILSPNREEALEKYWAFMTNQNIKEHDPELRAMFENAVTIGELFCDRAEKIFKEIKSLDQILFETGAPRENFYLIKAGSRKRGLKKYKKIYIDKALEEGHRLQDIADNINLSREAARIISKDNQ